MSKPIRLKRFGGVIACALLATALLARMPVNASPLATWSPTEIRSQNPGGTSVFPVIDYDAAGKAHIAWFEYGPTDADPSRVLYTNNVAGTWLTPFEVSNSGGRGAEPLLDIAIETNRVHFLYYTQAKTIAHRYVTLSGATPTKGPVTTLTTNKGANPHLAVDAAGRVHGVWITRTADTAPYQVYHRIWAEAWGAAATTVKPTSNEQKFPKLAMTGDGNLHLVFLNKDSSRFQYSIFNQATGAWTESTAIVVSGPKQISIAANGMTLMVLYSAQPGEFHNIYFIQGSGGSWTSPVLLSSGASYDEMPELVYSPANQTTYAFWASGSLPQDTRVAVREYTTSGFSPLESLGGIFIQYPRGAVSDGAVSAAWEDKVTGSYDVRMRTAALIPPVPPVGFAATVSPRPGKQIELTLSGVQGEPNEMRARLSAFAADAAAPAWGPVQMTSTLDAAAMRGCVATIWVQLRNTATGQTSPVQILSTVVDQEIQASLNLYPAEASDNAQPDAPAPRNPDYTRGSAFVYDISQEWAGCSGIARHAAGAAEIVDATYPYSGTGTYSSFDSGADGQGGGLIEQTVTATLVVTDTVGNSQIMSRTIYIDDDPPLLAPGGAITFTNGLTSDLALVPIAFAADVSDDGYPGPAGRQYWGLWAVATASATMPPPATFRTYGHLVRLAPGATTAEVRLINPAAGMGDPGPRFVHLRFLDGAGNYSESGLTSPQITLNQGFIGLRDYLPLLRR